MKRLKVLIFIGFCFLLSSCGHHESISDKLISQGYDNIITYNANGGSFGSDINVKYIYAKDGTVVPSPGEKPLATASLDGYNIEGWYTASLDDNGKPLEDEHGNIKLDKKWDFTQKVDESVVLYAKWQKNYVYNINFFVESLSDGSLSDSNYSQQFIVKESDKTFMGSIDGELSRVNFSGHTVMKFYSDSTCETLWNEDFTHPYSDSQTTVEIYARVLEGKFIFANEASDFKNMKTNSCYYLKSDIDFTYSDEVDELGNKVKLDFEDYNNLQFFGGKIVGNGYTLKNINYTTVDSKAYNIGLFNELINAELYDVTFDNCNVTIEFTKPRFLDLSINIGFLSGKLTNTILDNVSLANCNLKTIINDGLTIDIVDNSKYENKYSYGIVSSNPVCTIVDFNGDVTYTSEIKSKDSNE